MTGPQQSLPPGWRLGALGVPRTGESDLTDEELMIADVLFDMTVGRGALLGDRFGEVFNLPYRTSGRLSSVALDDMIARGITRAVSGDSPGRPRLALAAPGFSSWERERRPVWPAYCTTSVSFDEDDRQSLEVRGTERAVAEACWHATERAKKYGPLELPRVAIEENDWNVPLGVKRWVVLRAPLSGNDVQSTRGDSKLYESCRIWWGDLGDLLRSHRVPTVHRPAADPPPLYGTSP